MPEASSVFSGGAYEGDDDSVASLGSISVSAHCVRFETDHFTLDFPTQGLNVDLDNSGERVVFAHPAYPGWTVYSFEGAVLHHPALQRFGLRRKLEELRAAHDGPSKHAKRVYLAMGGFIALIVLIWAFTNPILTLVVNFMPPDWEQKIGQSAFEDFTDEYKISKDPALTNRLFAVTQRLKKGYPVFAPKFEFYVIDTDKVNAAALPGGKVVVMRGLMERATPDELAGVLAHEVSHVIEKHTMRQLAQIVGPVLAIEFFFDRDGALRSMTAAAAILGALQYSRDNETEADDDAFQILTQANIDPRSLASFFQKLRQIEKGHRPLEFLSTHPPTDARIKRMEKHWTDSPKKSGFQSIVVPET